MVTIGAPSEQVTHSRPKGTGEGYGLPFQSVSGTGARLVRGLHTPSSSPPGPTPLKGGHKDMATMFTITQKWVPEGAKLVLKKETASEFRCELVMGDQKGVTYIPKTVAPGCSTTVAKKAIASGMCSIYVEREDWVNAKKWQDRVLNHKSWKKDDLEP